MIRMTLKLVVLAVICAYASGRESVKACGIVRCVCHGTGPVPQVHSWAKKHRLYMGHICRQPGLARPYLGTVFSIYMRHTQSAVDNCYVACNRQ